MATKFPFFNFPVCKTYLGTWACQAHRVHEHIGHLKHVGHKGTLGTPFSRLYGNTQILIKTYMKKFVTITSVKTDRDVCGLRKLYDEVETSVKNLECGYIDLWLFINPLLNEKLSPDL